MGNTVMSIFSTLKSYATPWEVSKARKFTEEEISQVDNAKVVESAYGYSVCFHMISGGIKFIPLSTNSSLKPGNQVDMSKATLLTLSKVGSEDIYRVEA